MLKVKDINEIESCLISNIAIDAFLGHMKEMLTWLITLKGFPSYEYEDISFQNDFWSSEEKYFLFQPDTIMFSASYPAVQFENEEDLIFVMPYRYYYEKLSECIKAEYREEHPEEIKEVEKLMEELYLALDLDKNKNRIWEPYGEYTVPYVRLYGRWVEGRGKGHASETSLLDDLFSASKDHANDEEKPLSHIEYCVKDYRDLYWPPATPMIVEVPAMPFIMVDRQYISGQEPIETYEATAILHSLSYAIKMNRDLFEGSHDYVVFPFESLFWSDGSVFDFERRYRRSCTEMTRQPEFVTQEIFEWACGQVQSLFPEIDVTKARLEYFAEGLCAQIMHTGDVNGRHESYERLKEFIRQNGYIDMSEAGRKYHEIYLFSQYSGRHETIIRIPITQK